MLNPFQNRRVAAAHYETLAENDISRAFYQNGVVYNSPTGFFGKLFNSLTLSNQLDSLLKFYPYQKTVTTTKLEWEKDKSNYMQNAFILTGVTWALVFQLGRRGSVLPLLKEYGSFFKTHRVFRHYAYSPLLYFLGAELLFINQYHDHIEHLWTTHSLRLNNQILDDPNYTNYPESLSDKLRTVKVNPTFTDPQ